VGADIFIIHGKDYLLVVDYFSNFPEYVQLNSKSADYVIQHLKDIFSRHGIPETLVSDNYPFSSFAMLKNEVSRSSSPPARDIRGQMGKSNDSCSQAAHAQGG